MKSLKVALFHLLVALFLIPISSSCQNNQSPFNGLKNERMIEVLKEFPDKPYRWNVPASDGRLLYDLIIENNYKNVVEIGTSNGYSALWMGFALQETGGKLITIEINNERAMEARKNIQKAGLGSVVEVRINNAMKEIPKLTGLFDFVFLDADKSQYADYFNQLDTKLKSGGAVSAHNILTMEYAMQDFLNAIRNNPQYSTKTYQKSSQGILVGYKK